LGAEAHSPRALSGPHKQQHGYLTHGHCLMHYYLDEGRPHLDDLLAMEVSDAIRAYIPGDDSERSGALIPLRTTRRHHDDMLGIGTGQEPDSVSGS